MRNENQLIHPATNEAYSTDAAGETLQTEASRNLDLRGPTSIPILDILGIEVDRYQFAGEHARGGLGRILEARDVRLDRPVAVKELLEGGDEAEARFIREALITARLQHPAIVPVHDLGRSRGGKPFYTMKMVSGRSLAKVIDERRTLEERLALLPNIAAVADAMAYAHGRRVIHRDLKPSNILIGPFGETVVVDWGLASDLAEADKSSSLRLSSPYEIVAAGLTVAGTVLGTPEYMPAEQAEGKSVDERADVYALGAILYHLLAGSPPYEGSSSKEVLAKVTKREPVPLEKRESRVPKELATIVRKAMARSPAHRYPTAKELAADLERFQAGQLVNAHSYSRWVLIWKWILRSLHHRPPRCCCCCGSRLRSLHSAIDEPGAVP